MVIYVENPIESIKIFLKYSKVIGHNANIQKSTTFFMSGNEQLEIKIFKIPLIASKTEKHIHIKLIKICA